jgi:hypothetical protein
MPRHQESREYLRDEECSTIVVTDDMPSTNPIQPVKRAITRTRWISTKAHIRPPTPRNARAANNPTETAAATIHVEHTNTKKTSAPLRGWSRMARGYARKTQATKHVDMTSAHTTLDSFVVFFGVSEASGPITTPPSPPPPLPLPPR